MRGVARETMAEQHIVGVVLGASSLLVGYVIHKLAESQKERSYLQQVPHFRNFEDLGEYLSDPETNNRVLIEGVVESSGSVINSQHFGHEGAARLATCTKEYQESSESDTTSRWISKSSTTDWGGPPDQVPSFKLCDSQGNSVYVENTRWVDIFCQVMQRVWQEKRVSNSHLTDDSPRHRRVISGSLTSEFLLTFGTSIGAYGSVSRHVVPGSLGDKEIITFTPIIVGTSIRALVSPPSRLKYVSQAFLWGGGAIFLFSLMLILFQWINKEEHINNEELEQPVGADNVPNQ